MSRSSGNAITLKQLIKKGYSGREVRFFLLRSHYKSPIRFSFSYLDEALRAFKRLNGLIGEIVALKALTALTDTDEPRYWGSHTINKSADKTENTGDKTANDAIIKELEGLKEDFWASLYDDLNTPRAIGMLFQIGRLLSNKAWGLPPSSYKEAIELAYDLLVSFNSVLNILDLSLPSKETLNKVLELIHSRQEARTANDWKRADAIRKELLNMGVEVLDAPKGVRWRIIS